MSDHTGKILIHKHARFVFNIIPKYNEYPTYAKSMDRCLGKTYAEWEVNEGEVSGDELFVKVGGWTWPVMCVKIIKEDEHEDQ